jgi:O-antigen/teichoic acid export membrane protein
MTSPLSIEKKETVKLAGFLSLSAVIGRLLSIPSGIITAKYLGPAVFGALAVVNLIIQYSGALQLGLLQSFQREVPMAYGRGDDAEVTLIKNTIFSSFTVLSLFSIVLVWLLYAAGVTFKGVLDLPIVFLITLVIVSNRMMSFLETYIKAEGKFMIIGKSDLLLKFITPALNIPAVILFKLKGALLASFLTELIAMGYYVLSLKKIRFHFEIRVKKTVQLLKTGVILFINELSKSLFWNVDVMVLTAMTATTTVGIYSMALNTLGTADPLSQAINMTIYRKILVEGGKFGPAIKTHFRKYAESLLAGYLMLNSVILGCAILFYMFIIRTILTKYTESIPLMIILSFGYLVYISRTFFSYYLNVTNQLFKWMGIVLGGLGLNAVLDFIVLKLGYGLRGVAVSCSFSFLFIAILILGISLNQIYGTAKNAIALLAKIVLSSALLMGVLSACSRWNLKNYPTLPNVDQQILWGIVDLASKGILFSGLAVLLFSLIFKRDQPHRELKPVIGYIWSSFSQNIMKFVKKSTVPRTPGVRPGPQ